MVFWQNIPQGDTGKPFSARREQFIISIVTQKESFVVYIEMKKNWLRTIETIRNWSQRLEIRQTQPRRCLNPFPTIHWKWLAQTENSFSQKEWLSEAFLSILFERILPSFYSYFMTMKKQLGRLVVIWTHKAAQTSANMMQEICVSLSHGTRKQPLVLGNKAGKNNRANATQRKRSNFQWWWPPMMVICQSTAQPNSND